VDAGASWQVNHYSSTGVGRRINNIYFLNDEIGYAPAWTCVWRTGNGGNLSTAIPDAQATASALLYPNPSSNEVTLVLVRPGIAVHVIDMQGRTVIAPFRTTDLRSTLDVSALAAGMYGVVVALEQGITTLPLHKD